MNFNKKASIIIFIFIFITLISLFIRFWGYEELLNFHGDQPYYLHEVKDMVDSGKIKLIGPMVISKMIQGRGFFTGPTFYYLLAILGLISCWNVVFMTSFFTLLWVGTFALIFFWLRRKFGDIISLSIYGILSFLPFFIPYSRAMWNPNPIPLLGVLLFWFLEDRGKQRRNYLFAGLFFGLGLSVHYGAVLWGLLILYYLYADLKREAFSFKRWALFVVGVVIAEFPLLLFELRHNFYNLRTIIFQLKYFELSAGYGFRFYHYYLFPALPLLCRAYAIFLKKLKNTFPSKIIAVSQVILILILLMESLGPKRESVFYPQGWSLQTQKRVVDLIVNDREEHFEVATTINSDTRALELRWWLKQKGHQPMAVEDYDKADILYLVAPESRPPETEAVWEVKTLKPFEIIFSQDLGEGLTLYKLVRVRL